FRHPGWVEDVAIMLWACYFGSAQELKYLLLHPRDAQLIARSVSFRRGNVLRIFFNSGYFRCACARTGQRKCALICEAIQNTPFSSVARDSAEIVLLIEIETRLVSAQKIHFELHAFDFDYDLRRSSAQNAAA